MGSAMRKFRIWRWCPAHGIGLHTECTASVTLSMDVDSGVGTVLYSAPALWQYAYARQKHGFRDDELYLMLHARR